MSELTRYIVDTNTLGRIGRKGRGSRIFRELAMIPKAVADESYGFPDIAELSELVIEESPAILHCLIRVLAKVDPTETRLIDLYANKGAADPLIVATALDRVEADEGALIPISWVIVSDDAAVRRLAGMFQISVISNGEFSELLTW